ncbi:hypothetical protein DM02DRAFT_664285 [Periconia macrospinosa]|uniref:Uncharacterized protein n=1 Tax=Periconia macrospinosa TaxID=97972 RepID=A0A2V1CZL8_9PLEO|nr:hypothetical protein DM02DRAFT_664285 [Periconia macrospinosa]
MIHVPSLNQRFVFTIGPRDFLHTLSTLLGSFRGGNPTITNVLKEKLSALGISNSSPQGRLIDLASSEDEQDEKDSDWIALSALTDMRGAMRPLLKYAEQ